jgi:hypothetical protein
MANAQDPLAETRNKKFTFHHHLADTVCRNIPEAVNSLRAAACCAL